MSGGEPMELVRYLIDPAMSRFTVRAFASGMFSTFGHNPTIAIRDFSGAVQFVPGSLEKGELRLLINSDSLVVTDEISEKDRREMERIMKQDVLEVMRYPEITFESSNVSASRAGDSQFGINMVGKVSLHGVANTQPVAAQVMINGNSLSARGEFSLKQTTFGIKPVSVAGGTLKLKDDLKFSFDIVARKQ